MDHVIKTEVLGQTGNDDLVMSFAKFDTTAKKIILKSRDLKRYLKEDNTEIQGVKEISSGRLLEKSSE